MQHRRYFVWVFAIGLIFLVGISLDTSAFTARAAVPDLDPSIQSPVDANIACVNATATGCDAVCGGCYNNIQTAVNVVPAGGTVRIALGTYIGSGDTLVEISKPLTLHGSYDAACSVPFSGPTLLSGEYARTVIKVDSAGGMVTLNNLTFTQGIGDGNCDADDVLRLGGCGGGLYVFETPVTVNNCIFTNNIGNTTSGGPWGGAGGGGGAFVANYQTGAYAGFANCIFSSNKGSTSSVGWGGGLWIDAGSTTLPALIVYSTFTGNIASTQNQGHGGGANISGFVNINESDFYQNRAGADLAQFGYGGALYVWQTEGMDLTNSTFKMNKAVDTPWPGDSDASKGGAIFATTNVTMTAINNIIVKNTARDAGTAVYMESTKFDLPVNVWFWHNVIASNRGNTTSGVITIGHLEGTTFADFQNNIIAYNSFGIDMEEPFIDDLDTHHNCIWNEIEGFPGSFSINEDPMLTPGYYPLDESPVIDAGRDLSWLPGHPGLLADKDGTSRSPTEPNIGVYETTRNATFFPLLYLE